MSIGSRHSSKPYGPLEIKTLPCPVESIFDPRVSSVMSKKDEIPKFVHAVYFSLNIIRMIQTKRIRWAGHMVRVGSFERGNEISAPVMCRIFRD